MEEVKSTISRHTWERALRFMKVFVLSKDAGRRARWLFALLLVFMFGTNGLSVVNSYVNRAFMTAISNRAHAEFIRMGLIYIGVFAASTIVSVFYSFIEQRLGLVWREWMSRQAIFGYATDRVYYGLKMKGEIGNPDQRISEDVRGFTTNTLSYLLMLLNSTITVVAFAGVLWTISPLLFLVSVLYAIAGTFMTYLTGRPLIRLNYDQMDREADFRASLTYLRGNAESVALSRREGGLIQLNLRTLRDLVQNYRRIITINRNVSFLTTGYNWMIQIIPALIVAPLFINHEVEFGLITQSAIAFAQLVGAFSLIVTEFRSLTAYAATSARLTAMAEAGQDEKKAVVSDTTFTRDENRVAYQGLTLRSPRSGRVLIENLTIEVPYGHRVLVQAKDETARAALFHATAGLWQVSEGHIVRPPLEKILFMAELPYLPPSAIRELLLGPWPEGPGSMEGHLRSVQISDDQMVEALRTLKIDSLLARFGGLDTRHHWENTLPLEDQKLLVVARVLAVRPRFTFMDRPSSTLHNGKVEWILGLLGERGISCVVLEDETVSADLALYDSLLELKEGGAWSWKPVRDGRILEAEAGAPSTVPSNSGAAPRT